MKHENSWFQQHDLALNLRYKKKKPTTSRANGLQGKGLTRKEQQCGWRTQSNGPHNKEMPFDSDCVDPFADGACASLMKAQKNLMEISDISQ